MGFKINAFKCFSGLVDCFNDTISMRWIKDLNTKIENLAFELGGQHIWARYNDHATSKASFVT
jgi:hypothetical protein